MIDFNDIAFGIMCLLTGFYAGFAIAMKLK